MPTAGAAVLASATRCASLPCAFGALPSGTGFCCTAALRGLGAARSAAPGEGPLVLTNWVIHPNAPSVAAALPANVCSAGVASPLHSKQPG